jgi:hypothetical protein
MKSWQQGKSLIITFLRATLNGVRRQKPRQSSKANRSEGPVHEEADKHSADHNMFGYNAAMLDWRFVLCTIEHAT